MAGISHITDETREALEAQSGAPQRARAAELLEWYAQQARPFLDRNGVGQLGSLDRDFKELNTLVAAGPAEVRICLLGVAAVGKSTILNTLVGGSESIVPQGGVGRPHRTSDFG